MNWTFLLLFCPTTLERNTITMQELYEIASYALKEHKGNDKEDLMQDVVVKLWQVSKTNSSTAYLQKVAKNHMIDHYRKRKANTISLDDVELTENMDVDLNDDIIKSLNLNEKQTQYVKLKLAGLKDCEIAKEFKISDKNIYLFRQQIEKKYNKVFN